MVNYFFDSYAIIELIKGNPQYVKYSQEIVVTSIFHLIEVYWSILNNFDKHKAEENYTKFRDCVVDIDDLTLKEAIQFRKEHKQQDLSYADCIGYIYAKKNKLLFLTGDKEFKHLPHVAFTPA